MQRTVKSIILFQVRVHLHKIMKDFSKSYFPSLKWLEGHYLKEIRTIRNYKNCGSLESTKYCRLVILVRLDTQLQFKAYGYLLAKFFPVFQEVSLCSVKTFVKVTQSILCDPTDYTVHRILQARILQWGAFPFTSGSSQPRDRTQVSLIPGRFFTSWATREAQEYRYLAE